MPARICAEPTCANPAAYRGRCRIHSRDHNAMVHATGRLKPKSGRFYGTKRWQILRAERLAQEPMCRMCLKDDTENLATQVDHIRAVEDGGDPWDFENTQSLCQSHHSQKTIREVRARR